MNLKDIFLLFTLLLYFNYCKCDANDPNVPNTDSFSTKEVAFRLKVQYSIFFGLVKFIFI